MGEVLPQEHVYDLHTFCTTFMRFQRNSAISRIGKLHCQTTNVKGAELYYQLDDNLIIRSDYKKKNLVLHIFRLNVF